MPIIFNWNGDILKTPAPEDAWSTKLGTFVSSKNVTTYFPLPSKYRELMTVVGSYTVPAGKEKRPDLIAKELYGSEDLWWLIYWMSGTLDPFSGPKVGDIVLVADVSQVKALLS